MFVDGKRYRGTEGLWKLIVMKEPEIDKNLFDKTNAKFPVNRFGEEQVLAPNSQKLKFIEKVRGKEEGQDRKKRRGKKKVSGFLPSDPNALCERLELLMASKQAGNTDLRNEIVSICDELLKQKNLSHDAYKNLMLTLNK